MVDKLVGSSITTYKKLTIYPKVDVRIEIQDEGYSLLVLETNVISKLTGTTHTQKIRLINNGLDIVAFKSNIDSFIHGVRDSEMVPAWESAINSKK
jgi:hypothetical protein